MRRKRLSPLDSAAATRAWLDTVPAEKRARSDAYFEGGYWLVLWNFLLGAAISIFLLGSGLSARLRDFAERTTRFKTLQVALYAIPYVVIVAAFSFRSASIPTIFGSTPTGWRHKRLDLGSGAQSGSRSRSSATAILMMALYAVFRHAQRRGGYGEQRWAVILMPWQY